ncbi:hypothetical protein NNX28_01215 [Arthrobacter sp. zg-Y859]|uniref:Uncharacterized protein n=1 Tax=Arthrobacter jinronghuae TaxID=2964609 RepID=A0ABT1NLE7_9MICC|nr:hypothetical protein [Arthrobacter jinronghuae]MCQ1948545.1 hypothetical protein [Arthrobacter jinronghuae]UWX78635.1 hypothetical protein N2K98_17050 [Arthrobacter jinronghuae]
MGDNNKVDYYGTGAGVYPASPTPGAGTENQQHWPKQQWPPTPGQSAKQGQAPPQADPKQRRTLMIAGGVTAAVLVALIVGGYFGFKHLNENVYGPQVLAEEYLQAIVDGDVERAVGMGPEHNWQNFSLMTDEVYAKAENTITGFEVTDVVVTDGKADISVDIEQGDDTQAVTLDLRSDGTEALFFRKWKLNIGLESAAVHYILRGDATAVAVNGVDIPGQDMELLRSSTMFSFLPGDYTLDASTGSPYADYPDESVSVRLNRDGTAAAQEPTVDLKPVLTDAGREEIQAGITAHLEECMKSTELMPKGCPNQWEAEDPDSYRNISWSMQTAPTLDPIESDPTGPFSVRAVNGEFILDSEVNRGDSWQPQRESYQLYWMYAGVEINGEELSLTFAD